MTDPLTRLLAERDWLLADGGTGTTLFDMGLSSGEAPELWNALAPERVRALYDGAIAAGSDIFLTNSFGGNAARLGHHDAGDAVGRLNRAAATIAREAAAAAGREVIVAGSIGPTGVLLAPFGRLSAATAAEMFEEQARALIDGGVDILWVETMSAPEELEAAAAAVARTGHPWCCTMSFDTDGRTMSGLGAPEMVALVEGLPVPPVAYGANCGVGAPDLLRTLAELAAAGPGLPLIAKANAGIPKLRGDRIIYDGTPDLMAEYAVLARDCGARIIGGCCGTGPEHLSAMRAALSTAPRGPLPDPATIEARVGPFTETPLRPGSSR